MNHIGEYPYNQAILLELLLTDDESNPLEASGDVLIHIEGPDGVLLGEEENVKMNMISGSVFEYTIEPDETWPIGDYIIRYTIPFEEETIVKEESFSLIIEAEEEEDDEEEEENFLSQFVYTPGLQIDAKVSVEKDVLIIEIDEAELQNNRDYTIVLTADIESESGLSLKKDYKLRFSSEYYPLYASVSEVRHILRSLRDFFDVKEILTCIRNAGIKGHQMKRLEANPDAPQFIMIQNNEQDYYPMTRYVSYEAARSLIENLIIDLVNGEVDENQVAKLTGGFTLGDLNIQPDGGQSRSNDQPIDRLNRAIEALQIDLKFWQDAMMGHNRRGYAEPSAGEFRGGAMETPERDF